MRPTVLLAAMLLLLGCDVGAVNPDPDATALADVDGYRDLQRIDTRPFTSNVGAFEVNCYVAGDVTSYREIHPERDGSRVHVAVGTVIVREVLNASGEVDKLTVMAKQAPGYDASLGDWWFGVTDVHGVPLMDDKGREMLGRLSDCHSCHDARGADDFLFGVSAALE